MLAEVSCLECSVFEVGLLNGNVPPFICPDLNLLPVRMGSRCLDVFNAGHDPVS